MIVPAHSLVSPPWSYEQSIVICSILKEHCNVFCYMSVFFLGSVHDIILKYILTTKILEYKQYFEINMHNVLPLEIDILH